MIKLLAWQRIQQLFPPKAPSPQTAVSPAPALKPPPALSDSEPPAPPSRPASVGADLKLKLSFRGQKKVQARAVFYPLTGKGQAVNMCYRTLYIGSGEAPQLAVKMLERRHCFADATVFSPPKVLTWTCALRTTVIATTYPGNTPVFSTMRHVAVSMAITLRRRSGANAAVVLCIHAEHQALRAAQLQRARHDGGQRPVLLRLL